MLLPGPLTFLSPISIFRVCFTSCLTFPSSSQFCLCCLAFRPLSNIDCLHFVSLSFLLCPQSPPGSPALSPLPSPVFYLRLRAVERHLYTRGQIPPNSCLANVDFSPGKCFFPALNKHDVFEVTFCGSRVVEYPTHRPHTHTPEEDRALLSLCTLWRGKYYAGGEHVSCVFCSLLFSVRPTQ